MKAKTNVNRPLVYDQRHDILLVSSVTNSLHQGTALPGNPPNVDENGYALITPPGMKKKIRAGMERKGEKLYISQNGDPLEQCIRNAVTAIGVTTTDGDDDEDEIEVEGNGKKGKKGKKSGPMSAADIQRASLELAREYIDIRFFGAVLTKPVNSPITGPVQVGFSTSLEPVSVSEFTVSRSVVTKIEDLKTKNRELGQMSIVPHAVFVTPMSLDPFRAKAVNFTWNDYDLLMEILPRMYDLTRSTTRYGMCLEKIIIFKHESPYGNAQALKLFRRVKISPKNGATRSFEDYKVEVDTNNLNGVDVKIIDPE